MWRCLAVLESYAERPSGTSSYPAALEMCRTIEAGIASSRTKYPSRWNAFRRSNRPTVGPGSRVRSPTNASSQRVGVKMSFSSRSDGLGFSIGYAVSVALSMAPGRLSCD